MKSKNVLLTLTVAIALSMSVASCNDGNNDWRPDGQFYGRNQRGDSIMTRGGYDYYYRSHSWILIPNGYYHTHYINGSGMPHSSNYNSSFSRSYSSARSSQASSHSSFGSSHSSSSSRGGFGGGSHGGSSAS